MYPKSEIAQNRLKFLVETVMPALAEQIRVGDGIRQSMIDGLELLTGEKRKLENSLGGKDFLEEGKAKIAA